MALLKKIKGFTLLETLVSMVIVTSCFMFGLMIFTGVSGSQNGHKILKATSLINRIEHETLRQKAFFDEAWQENEFEVSRKISRYMDIEGLYLLKIEVKNADGKLISESNRLFFEHE